jgi:hypothetical protein
MRRRTHHALGLALALGAVGVLAGCESPESEECALAGVVRDAVEQVASFDESSTVESAEAAQGALLDSVQELKARSESLRTVDIKALNEGLAEVSSAVSSVSGAETVESAVSSLQGSARDLETSLHELEDHFGCS